MPKSRTVPAIRKNQNTTIGGRASSVHAVRGLICTRGQGPRLYTRNGFAVCTSLFLQLCILCAPCVQVILYRSSAVVFRVKSYL